MTGSKKNTLSKDIARKILDNKDFLNMIHQGVAIFKLLRAPANPGYRILKVNGEFLKTFGLKKEATENKMLSGVFSFDQELLHEFQQVLTNNEPTVHRYTSNRSWLSEQSSAINISCRWLDELHGILAIEASMKQNTGNDENHGREVILDLEKDKKSKEKPRGEPVNKDTSRTNLTDKVKIDDTREIWLLHEENKLVKEIIRTDKIAFAISQKEDGKYILANKGFAKITGYTREEIIGKTSRQLGFLSDKYREYLSGELAEKGYANDVTLTFLTKQNKVKTINFSISEINYQNKPCYLAVMMDITALVRTREKLVLEKKTYFDILNSANVSIFQFDPSARITYVNDYGSTLFGYKPAELIGKHVANTLLPPRDSKGKSLRGLPGDIIANPAKYDEIELENENITKSGETLYMRWINKTIYTATGKLKGFTSIGINQTDYKKTLYQLKESEKKFRLAFYNANDAILWADIETGKIINCNPAAEKLFERKREELIGLHQTELHPREEKERHVKEFKKGSRGELVENMFSTIITKNKKIKHVKIKSSSTEVNGKKVLQGIFHDITRITRITNDLQISEGWFKESEKVANLGHYTINLEEGTAKWSDQLFRIFGMDPLKDKEPNIQEYYHMVHPHDLGVLQDHFQDAVNKSKSFDLEYRIMDNKGDIHHVHSVGKIIRDKQTGKPLMFGIYQDITRRKLAEKALAESERKYKTLVESLPDIIYIYSSRYDVTYVSSSIQKILGYTGKEMKQNPRLWYKAIKKQHRKLKDDAIAGCRFNKAYDIEYQVKDKNGKYHWLRDRKISSHKVGEEIIIEGIASDITSLKEAETSIKILSNAIENSGNEIYIFDRKNLSINFANKRAERNTGYNREELERISFLELQNDLSLKDFKDKLSSLESSNEKSIRFETLFSRKDTSLYPVEVNLSKVPLENNNLFLSIVTDITERKKIQEQLIRSEENFRMIFNNAPLGIFRSTEQGKFIEVNPKLAELLGYKNPEEVLKNIKSIGKDVYVAPVDRERTIDLAYEGKDILITENTYKRRNGELFIGRLYLKSVKDQEGKIEYLEGIVEDITEQKAAEKKLIESEERFRRLFEENAAMMLIINPLDGKIMEANKAALSFYGYSSKEMNKLHIFDLNLLNNERIREEMSLAVEYTKNYFMFQHRLKNGDKRAVEVYSTPLKFGRKILLFSIIHDITDRKKAEDALKKSERSLKELNTTKDRFFSIIAHDLKNPFNSILGLSELLARVEEIDAIEKTARYGGLINEAAKSGFHLLENLLEWSRAQTGRLKFEPEIIFIREIVDEAYSLLKLHAITKNIKTVLDVPSEITVFADRNMIRTVIRNLLSNAIKFTPPDGLIVVGANIRENEVHLVISDTGKGMSPENQQKLFRIEETYTTPGTGNEKGSGLGLILCKELVEKNKGKIWVTSKPGEGSNFGFSLPLGSF